MPGKRTTRVKCFVWWCDKPLNTKGLCGSHYQEYKLSKEWKQQVEEFELEATHNPPTMSYWTYMKKLRALVRDTGVPEEIRVPFIKAMANRYADELGREREYMDA
jgi:hypothetical protein